MSVSRRAFLASGASASAALLIGFRLYGGERIDAEPSAAVAAAAKNPNPFDTWLRLDADGRVTVIVAKSEMGQGVFTSLPMILADELGVDWDQIRIEQALTRPDIYPHGTGGSSSVRTSWLPLRRAGAAARDMLIAAAAASWRVDPASCRVEKGFVLDAGGTRRATFAELIPAAARLPVPDLKTVRLKDASELRLVGTSPVRRDIIPKIEGDATFGLDVRVPGMLYAVVARCPTIDGKPRRFDATRAKQVPGVRDVFEIPAVETLKGEGGIVPVLDSVHAHGGIAVVGDTTWAAIRGRQALEIEWDPGPNAQESSEALRAQFVKLLDQPGKPIRNDGDAEGVYAKAPVTVESVYELPLTAHATMEPMNCTVHVQEDGAQAWVPSQGPEWAQQTIALLARLPLDKVTVHTTFMGGAFGRRYTVDWVTEATQVSLRMKAPIQLVWTREDDFQYDFYRQASMHRLRGAIDADGRAVAWSHRFVSTSAHLYWPRSDEIAEATEVPGAANAPYDIPNFRLDYSPAITRIPIGWWRSVEHSYTGFVVESFVDEMATAAKVDPLEFRLRLLETAKDWRLPWDKGQDFRFERERLINVLKLVADRAGWHSPPPTGRARGVACAFGFCTYVAEVAEVSIENGKPRVHRVVCAVDCGRVVHPSNAAAQIEGAIVYGLSATLGGEITFDKGQAQQRNFDTFKVPRLTEAPQVEVHFVPSTAVPTGCGEPGLPPIAPAVANALFALTGTRHRKLPVRL